MNDAPIAQADEGGVVVPRSPSPFPAGIRLGLEGGLDADDLARRALGEFNKVMIPENAEDIPRATASNLYFSFKGSKTGALTASMLSGGITLGPFTRIEWSSITSASLTITVDDITPKWFVWLSVDVRMNIESAEWHEGASIQDYWDGLTEAVQKYTAIVPLIEITATDKSDPPDDSAWSIDEVKNLQCGDAYIPRL